MNHLDLFSGIGGFALAVDNTYGKENTTHTFVEIDPFCQAVLKKHWPESAIYGDIKTFTYAEHAGLEGEAPSTQGRPQHFRHDGNRVRPRPEPSRGNGIDLLTGGFPCQPFSAAGRRAGTADDRHLWPEMLRVIRETNPRWVIGENVRGFLTWNGGMVLDEVFSDLEGLNYEVGAFVIPAVAVDAPHRRDRVWIVAHAAGARNGGKSYELFSPERRQNSWKAGEFGSTDNVQNVADPGNQRLQGNELSGALSEGEGTPRPASERTWNEDWPEVAARLCALDDGLSNGLARPRGWRNAALKGVGNAIVPQIAMEILQAIKSCETDPASGGEGI